MAERISTGFADALNVTGDVKTIMANGVIHVYSGTQPTTADSAETGDLLLIFTLDSGAFTPGVATNGLNMGLSSGGVLSKSTAETWSGDGLAAAGASPGTIAGWFRWYDNDVTTGASTTAIRLDGLIGTSSSYEMQMSNTSIVEDNPVVCSTHTYTTPLS